MTPISTSTTAIDEADRSGRHHSTQSEEVSVQYPWAVQHRRR